MGTSSKLEQPSKTLKMRVLTKMKRLVSKQKLNIKSRDDAKSPTKLADEPTLKDPSTALNKKRLDKGRSTPAINVTPAKKKVVRSASQPVLAAFVPAYVDQLKAQPFSLKEKITRWCKKSPMALYRSHMPPEDHHVPFPNEPYPDLMCDKYGRSIILEAEKNNPDAPTTKPRMECVLKRYPPNLHGILSSYDQAELDDKNKGVASTTDVESRQDNAPVAAARKPRIAMPPPSFDNVKPKNLNAPSSAMDQKQPQVSKAPPPMPKRVPTNLSMIPHRCMSHLNETMLAQALQSIGEKQMVPVS